MRVTLYKLFPINCTIFSPFSHKGRLQEVFSVLSRNISLFQDNAVCCRNRQYSGKPISMVLVLRLRRREAGKEFPHEVNDSTLLGYAALGLCMKNQLLHQLDQLYGSSSHSPMEMKHQIRIRAYTTAGDNWLYVAVKSTRATSRSMWH